MKIIIFLLAGLFTSSSFAELQIDTIQLNHRLASEILPEIQALLPQQATARVFNEFIILNADSKTRTQLKKLIRTLDVPLKRLKISVLNTHHPLKRDADTQVEVKASTAKKHNAGQYQQHTISHIATKRKVLLAKQLHCY